MQQICPAEACGRCAYSCPDTLVILVARVHTRVRRTWNAVRGSNSGSNALSADIQRMWRKLFLTKKTVWIHIVCYSVSGALFAGKSIEHVRWLLVYPMYASVESTMDPTQRHCVRVEPTAKPTASHTTRRAARGTESTHELPAYNVNYRTTENYNPCRTWKMQTKLLPVYVFREADCSITSSQYKLRRAFAFNGRGAFFLIHQN